jgi:hypothetical protein
MSSTLHSVKVGAAWITIAYVICFAGVALFPNIRTVFLQDALHMEANFLGRHHHSEELRCRFDLVECSGVFRRDLIQGVGWCGQQTIEGW